jgi:hypothetical protein
MGLESPDSQEATNDINKVGYYNSYMGYKFAMEALAAAMEWAREHGFPSGGGHNDAQDAFRHCFWSCTMARYLGESPAEIIADEHEKAGDRNNAQPAAEERMDRANNMVGRNCANQKNKNCWDACTDLYLHGRLFGLGGAPLLP